MMKKVHAKSGLMDYRVPDDGKKYMQKALG